MLELFFAYKKYPYRVSLRNRFFNVFRYFFKIPFLERILIHKILKGNIWWRKFTPPMYFYEHCTMRRAERNNITYWLDISCLIDHSIFFCTLKESAWDNLFKLLHRNFIIIDAGANIGFLTLNLAQHCYDGFVFAFEPDGKTFRTLKANIEQNGFKNIAAYQIALGARSEKMLLSKLEINNPGANRILPKNSIKQYDTEWVDVTTLDEFTSQLPIARVDLLKIDVEGFEMFVLKGAEKIIQKWKPILFVELSEVNLKEHGFSARLLIDYIESLNYEVRDARTMQMIDKSETNYHTDILCFQIAVSL
jgi:FkbM family methyltransferase